MTAAGSSPPSRLAPWALALESSLALVAAGLGWLFDYSPLSTLRDGEPGWGDEWRAAAVGALAALPPLIALWAWHQVSWEPARRLRDQFARQLVPALADCTWLDMFLLSIAAGVGEELLFRGLLQDGLAHAWGGPWGIALGLAVASLAFGLVHALSSAYVVLATVMGFYLGLVFLATDHVLAPVVLHAVYDFGALAYLLRIVKPPSDGTANDG